MSFKINTSKSLAAFKQMFKNNTLDQQLLHNTFKIFFDLISNNYNKYQNSLNLIKKHQKTLSYNLLYDNLKDKNKEKHEYYKNQCMNLLNMIQCNNYCTINQVYCTLCQNDLISGNKIPGFNMRTLKSIAENVENKLNTDSDQNISQMILDEMKQICHPDLMQCIAEIDDIETQVNDFNEHLETFKKLLETAKDKKSSKNKGSSSSE